MNLKLTLFQPGGLSHWVGSIRQARIGLSR